jgi:hypothetical protein
MLATTSNALRTARGVEALSPAVLWPVGRERLSISVYAALKVTQIGPIPVNAVSLARRRLRFGS